MSDRRAILIALTAMIVLFVLTVAIIVALAAHHD